MASTTSSEMQSVCIPSYTKPSGYGVGKLPKPVIDADTEVIVKVLAASINPIDVKKANGEMKMIVPDRFDVVPNQRMTSI
jgi:NADPH:quinone reductase-like Zn-dependent oxidoreductase